MSALFDVGALERLTNLCALLIARPITFESWTNPLEAKAFLCFFNSLITSSVEIIS
jgi:hypothetical protein